MPLPSSSPIPTSMVGAGEGGWARLFVSLGRAHRADASERSNAGSKCRSGSRLYAMQGRGAEYDAVVGFNQQLPLVWCMKQSMKERGFQVVQVSFLLRSSREAVHIDQDVV